MEFVRFQILYKLPFSFFSKFSKCYLIDSRRFHIGLTRRLAYQTSYPEKYITLPSAFICSFVTLLHHSQNSFFRGLACLVHRACFMNWQIAKLNCYPNPNGVAIGCCENGNYLFLRSNIRFRPTHPTTFQETDNRYIP